MSSKNFGVTRSEFNIWAELWSRFDIWIYKQYFEGSILFVIMNEGHISKVWRYQRVIRSHQLKKGIQYNCQKKNKEWTKQYTEN